MCEQDRIKANEEAVGTLKVGLAMGVLVIIALTLAPPILSRDIHIEDLWNPSSIGPIEGELE